MGLVLGFLPVWEGVSALDRILDIFPDVSSLYGRVYRYDAAGVISAASFLPVWEGVSCVPIGCVENVNVSSLYGRVYR